MNQASFRIPWAQLGWVVDPQSNQGDPERGPIRILVISPWCPDCVEATPAFRELRSEGRSPVYLAGEFAPPEAIRQFARDHHLEFPLLFGNPEKTQIARIQARFHQIRTAFGDTRTWGVPALIQGRIELGVLAVTDLNLTF